jgi:hypothetical protein
MMPIVTRERPTANNGTEYHEVVLRASRVPARAF